jgi:hypothetical protein
MHVGGISCDLAIAFDCVNYELLLTRLRFYGVKNKLASGLSHTFMTERKQY